MFRFFNLGSRSRLGTYPLRGLCTTCIGRRAILITRAYEAEGIHCAIHSRQRMNPEMLAKKNIPSRIGTSAGDVVATSPALLRA